MLALLLLSTAVTCAVRASSDIHRSFSRSKPVETRHIFNPRMDYDEWTPLGRGDPLKNDPTYDYVPPVLERVHYWIDPSKRTPDPPLSSSSTTILVRTEPTTATPAASSRLDTMTLLDPFLKLMDASKATYSTYVNTYFRPTLSPATGFTSPPIVSVPYGVPNPPREVHIQRPPHTMLVPPPLPSSTELGFTSFGTSTASTTMKVAENITLSPLLSTIESTTDTTTATPATTGVTSTTHLANSENLYKPVAINMPENISNVTREDEEEQQQLSEVIVPPSLQSFQEGTNHLQDIRPPSLIMVPPRQNSDDYYDFRPTTIRTTTAITTLTTDPMFKHYKQPSEPMRGPLYLIIQGHSKVKTYGASKNKVKAVSSNEINFEDGKPREDYDDLSPSESYRRERKLRFKDSEYIIDDDNAEVVQGHPVVELAASYKSKGPVTFRISNDDVALDELEEAFPKSSGGKSKKRVLANGLLNETSNRRRRFASRRLLEADETKPNVDDDHLDQDQLGLESLIALNDDYNSGDVINLLLKEEGQGSGLGNFVSSLLSRSVKHGEDI